MTWESMLQEMRRDLWIVQITCGIYGVGCTVYSVAEDPIAGVIGRGSLEEAVRDAYAIWKARSALSEAKGPSPSPGGGAAPREEP